MTRMPSDLPASIRQRLFQRSRDRSEDFQLTLQRYAVERLLFRLERSPYRDRFILKGAMLYVVWGGEVYRPTRDLDLLGYGPAEAKPVAECFRALCTVEVLEDGLRFLPASVRAEEIRETGEYGGIRIRIEARLAKIQIPLQVDIGFGDLIVPGPEEVEFPALLNGPAPRIRAYSRESVVAEKLHAAVRLGDVNSRMKDFYDLFALAKLHPFDGPVLISAIGGTFERRCTPLPSTFPLQASFFEQQARAVQWRAYLARTGLETAVRDFSAVGETVRRFLAQPYEALVTGVEFPASWLPGGPWR